MHTPSFGIFYCFRIMRACGIKERRLEQTMRIIDLLVGIAIDLWSEFRAAVAATATALYSLIHFINIYYLHIERQFLFRTHHQQQMYSSDNNWRWLSSLTPVRAAPHRSIERYSYIYMAFAYTISFLCEWRWCEQVIRKNASESIFSVWFFIYKI